MTRKRKAPAARIVRDRLRGALAAVLLVAAGPAGAQDAEPPTLLLFGDSLMAGYGLSPAEGFAAQLEAALAGEGLAVEIVNASVAGDTSANGLARLDWTLAEIPDAAVIGLGANDMMRGIRPEVLWENLAAILDRFAAEDVPVLLAGMMANRGLGEDYVAAFDAVYPELAEAYDNVTLYPFFLEGVALDSSLNQSDGIHPNAAGVAVIVEQLAPYVIDLLHEVGWTGV